MTARRRDKALTLVAAAARVGKELFDNMTAPIPTKQAGPTAAELRARRTALLDQIKAAATALAEAQAQYETDFSTFTDSENEATGQSLWLSEQRIKARTRKMAELQQQLEALDGAIGVAARGELEQRDREIDAELADNRQANELDAAAAKVAACLVDALLEIRAHNVRREQLRGEQRAIREQLGMQTEPATFRSVEASLVGVAIALRELANSERDPVRRGYLVSLSMGHVDFLPQPA